MVSFPEAIRLGFKGYVNFRGRATRAEYWWWTLFIFICELILGIADTFVAAAAGFAVLTVLFGLLTLLPYLALTARRLHDTNRSGWWQLAWYAAHAVVWAVAVVVGSGTGAGVAMAVVGLVGTIAVIIWMLRWLVQESDPGENRHG